MGRKSDAREKLIAVARHLIWEQSYNAVGVESICREADVNKGSFYHFFPSKEALAMEALEHSWLQLEETVMRPAFSPDLPPLERFTRFCRNVQRLFSQVTLETGGIPGCPIINCGAEAGVEDETMRTKVEDIFARQTAYFEEALKEAKEEGTIRISDAGAAARFIHAFLSGLILQAKVFKDPDGLKLLLPGLARLIGAEVRGGRMVKRKEG